MGLLSWLRGDSPVLRYGLGDPFVKPTGVVTPWAGESHLSPAVVLDDIFDAQVKPVTRAEAMSIPAWNDARSLVCDVISRHPLKAYDAQGVELVEQPRWLNWSAIYPPRLRMVWTIDDLAHHGWSLWVTERGAPDGSGRRQILDAARVAWDRWTFEQTGNGIRIKVTEPTGQARFLADDEYILFPGLAEGLLTTAADTIRGAKSLETQWTARVKNPLPIVEIRYVGDEDLTEDEQRDIRAKYLAARNDPEGVVMVTPRGFEVHATTADDVQMFVAGRNAVGLDIARFWKIRASMLDISTVNGSSVTYENASLGRSAYSDLTLQTWAMPIAERLSQDDVHPRGTYVDFDFSALTETPDTGTGPVRPD